MESLVEISAQPSSQDQPALAQLLITGHQSGGSEAQPGPSSLHLLEQLLPDCGLAGDAAEPHLLPSALAPTLSRSQVQEKAYKPPIFPSELPS